MSDTQMTIEQTMVQRGAERVRTHNARATARGTNSERLGLGGLVRNYVETLTNAVAERLVAEEAKRGLTKFFGLVGHVPPDILALVTLRVALDMAPSRPPLTRMARAVGRAVEDELRLEAIFVQDPALFASQTKKMRRRGAGLAHARAAWSAYAKQRSLDIPRWPVTDSLAVGIGLLDVLLQSTPLCETALQATGKGKTQHFIGLTKEAIEWADARDEALALARPLYLPTDTPPIAWSGIVGGGYGPPILPLPLVKVTAPEHRELLKTADLSPTINALNAVQATQWQINDKVLAVMQEAHANQIPLPMVPTGEEPLPPRPDDLDTNEEALRAWRYQAKMVYERRQKARSSAFEFARLLDLGSSLVGQTIWFPHQLDFRARMYAVPVLLSPQGRDEARGLLRFREELPVTTQEAWNWASINGANLFGEDKVPLSERLTWASRHADMVNAIVQDPLSNRQWTEADKPWSFLAWCYDWQMIRERGVTSIPVALDGSCNGIQHFSAILRDPVGGAAVNLIPADRPQDIYAEVANVVNRRLKQRAAAGDWRAGNWLAFGINRSATKRPVMVLPYGGTRASCGEYVALAVRKAIEDGAPNPFGDDLRDAIVDLSSEVWASMGEVVVGARTAMRWLQTVAGIAARHNLPMIWTNPAGFTAYQRYPLTKLYRVKTKMRGSVIRPTVYMEQPEIDPRRQALAISPNFIHSQDAAALALTVNRCVASGITSFAMIHDSYGTHASRTPELARHLREAFVSMYENHDVLQELRDQLVQMLPAGVAVPPPPAKGSLDLRLVLDSPYFFA
jgi:DNA-directed RNA polymerase, mitochondrial